MKRGVPGRRSTSNSRKNEGAGTVERGIPGRHVFANPGLSIVELDGDVIERATRLRARHGLRTPDALQAASALTLPENPAIVTGDKDFRKIPELNVHLVE